MRPDLLLSPLAPLLQQHSLRNFPGQSEDQRDDVFGNNRAVNFPRICEDHVTVHEFRKEELMNCRGGSVDPTQFASDGKLLGAQGDREYDFRIAQIFFNALIAVALHDLQVRKICRKPLHKPCRDIPEIKAVMNDQ